MIVGTKGQVSKALTQVARVVGSTVKTITTKVAMPADDDDFYMVDEDDYSR